MARCYISPSLQTSNEYAGGTTTEAKEMRPIAEIVGQGLSRCKIENKLSAAGMTLAQAIADSNSYLSGLPAAQIAHVSIHSNAGGGVGTEAWIYATGGNAERLANCIYNTLAPLTPGADRGIKVNASFAELRDTVAPAVIIETEFHDNTTGAQYIVNHHAEIAEAIVKGICQFFGVQYVSPNQPAPAPTPSPELAALQKQITDLQAQLAGVSKDKDSLADQVQALDQQLTDFKQWIDLTKKLLGA